jgi:hypothetical protein
MRPPTPAIRTDGLGKQYGDTVAVSDPGLLPKESPLYDERTGREQSVYCAVTRTGTGWDNSTDRQYQQIGFGSSPIELSTRP